MVTSNLEQTEAGREQSEIAEGAEEVSEAAEQVSEKAEEVSAEAKPTFNQEYIDNLIVAKEKEWQSRKDEEFSRLQNEVGELRKKVTLASLATQEQKELESWGDTPEVRDFQGERRKFFEEKDTIVSERDKFRTIANKAEMATRFYAAKEIADKHPGLDVDYLLRCKSPDEMQEIVKLYENLKENLQEGVKAPQKIDSGVTQASGVNLSNMTPSELIKWGIEHPTKE